MTGDACGNNYCLVVSDICVITMLAVSHRHPSQGLGMAGYMKGFGVPGGRGLVLVRGGLSRKLKNGTCKKHFRNRESNPGLSGESRVS